MEMKVLFAATGVSAKAGWRYTASASTESLPRWIESTTSGFAATIASSLMIL